MKNILNNKYSHREFLPGKYVDCFQSACKWGSHTFLSQEQENKQRERSNSKASAKSDGQVGDHHFNSFLMITRKFSDMTGTLLYVFGSHERHFEFTNEMYIPLRPIPMEDTLHHCLFYKVGNSQIFADQSTWQKESNWAEYTSSERC